MRLIVVDDLLKELEEWEADLYDTTPERQLGVTDAIVIACQMPDIDAVPVVRCKDCSYYGAEVKGKCPLWCAFIYPEGYCFRAERKEE